jgi:hypothetical protein
MSVKRFGTRPAVDCLEGEDIAMELGWQRYFGDGDGRELNNSLIHGYRRSNANVVLPV